MAAEQLGVGGAGPELRLNVKKGGTMRKVAKKNDMAPMAKEPSGGMNARMQRAMGQAGPMMPMPKKKAMPMRKKGK